MRLLLYGTRCTHDVPVTRACWN